MPGFPYVRRITADEFQTFDPYEKANDGNTTTFTTLPVSAVASILQALILKADAQVTLRFNGQTDKGITLNAGGLLLLLDTAINSAVFASINNNSGGIANVRGLGAGT